jgi:hypothetical protein
MHELDAQVLTRSDDRGNGQYVKKTSRRPEKLLIDLTQLGTANLHFYDGLRVIIDPECARQILDECSFAGRRPINPATRRAHRLDMQRRRFRAGSQLAFAQLPNSKQILVNGYHRLNAVIDSGALVEFQVLVERVKNHEEVRDLYCSIDTSLRMRTDADVVRAAGTAEKLNVRHGVMTAALGAVTIIASGLRMRPPKDRPDEVVTAYGRKDHAVEWANEIRVYGDIVAKATSQKLRSRLLTQAIMAVALVTLRYAPGKARHFWTSVAENDGLRKGNPKKALVKALLESTHRGRPHAGLIYAAQAWNAWFEGRDLHRLRAYETSKCEPLGTPYAAAADKKTVKQSKRSDG